MIGDRRAECASGGRSVALARGRATVRSPYAAPPSRPRGSVYAGSWASRMGGRRSMTVAEVNPAEGYWCLDFELVLSNVSGRELRFGSPITEGLPAVGYGGLFWTRRR